MDIPTCKNVVLARVISSMTEFKQIIGRGTRVFDDYGKYYFNIIDYTGSATTLFADPAFDGDPVRTTEEIVNEEGQPLETEITQHDNNAGENENEEVELLESGDKGVVRERQKYYVDGVRVKVESEATYELDAGGNRLRMVKLIDYTAERVRNLYPNAASLRTRWANPQHRKEIIDFLEEKGITFRDLAAAVNQPDADPFDLLCYIVFSTPLRTRRERASNVHRQLQEAFKNYREEARTILDTLLELYAIHGVAQFTIPDVFDLSPLSDYGNILEIATLFGGTEKLREAVQELQTLLYAA